MTFVSDYFVTLGIDPFIAGLVIGIILMVIARALLGGSRKGSAYALVNDTTVDAARPVTGLAGGPGAMLRITYRINGTEQALGPEVAAQIANALAGNNKIQAIKILREASGLGLKEAKDIVEVIEGAGR